MENKELLDKIIEGTQMEEQVTIPFNGEDYTFTLKPLTSGQLSTLQRIERKGLNININGKGKASPIDINAGDLADNQAEAMFKGISFSLDAPVEKVKLLPLEIVEALFKEIIRISKLSDNELILVKNFHEDN